METYVYYIEDGHGHVKIGVSSEPEKRLKQCQTGNPYKLYIKNIERYNSCGDAYRREKELHNRFKKFRLCGEWFEATYVDLFKDKEIATYQDYINIVLERNLKLK